MDPQVVSIRRFMVWAVVWALTLALVAGLFLWKAPIRAAGVALPTPVPAGAQFPSPTLATPAGLEPTNVPGYFQFFPLIFNRADPYIPGASGTP
jgi:hypothetical protein